MFGKKANYSTAIAACPRSYSQSFGKKICFSSLKRIKKEIFAEKRDGRKEKKKHKNSANEFYSHVKYAF